MAVSPITSESANAIDAWKQAAGAPADNSLGKDAFLQLLVAQLRYQNPLEPADPTQFMTQTAQFTMVEKLDELTNLTHASSIAQKLSTASALIGKEIDYLAEDGTVATGVVESARLGQDTTYLKVGTLEVPIEFLISVRSAPASA